MTNGNNLKGSIDNRIEIIGKATKTLFIELGAASREILLYVPESKDIGIVNRLLNVLNAHDRNAFVIFIKEFLPWKYEETTGLFAGMLAGERRHNDMAVVRDLFLKSMIDDGNGKSHEATFWDWAKDNIQAAERKVDFNNNLVSLIQRATAEKNKDGTENKYRISNRDVITDIMNAGVTLDDLMAVVTEAEAAKKKAEAEAKKAAEAEARKAANANKKRERKAAVAVA